MKDNILQKRDKKGFTLVELVIVVAVLAIIAGIAIPTVHNVIDNANKAADASNAQSIELTIKTCQSELAAEKTNGANASLTKVKEDVDKKLTTLLKAYGVDLDLQKLKQSSAAYYYDSTSGKVVASTTKPDGYEILSENSIYTIDGSTLTIDADGKT